MQQTCGRADPAAGALGALYGEAELALVVAHVARIHLDHAVGRAEGDPSQQQGAAYQFGGQIVPAGPVTVDGEARVLHQPPALPAQCVHVLGKAGFDPCGFPGLAVTQLADLGVAMTVERAGETLAPILAATIAERRP